MSGHPFPFVGAGDASYFERAEVHVRFTRAPKPAERKRIVAGIPPPLAESVDFEGAHLVVCSAQGVGRLIESTYGKNRKAPTRLTTSSRFKQASSVRTRRFNDHIESWLHAAHSVVPIVVAFRRQDLEAGGTVMSSWHEDSLERGASILKRLGTPKAKAEAWMVKRIAGAIEAVKHQGPTPSDEADAFFQAYINVPNQKDMLAKARGAVATLESAEALWRAADMVADYVACWRSAKVLSNDGSCALALVVFRRALVGTNPADHVAAFRYQTDAGCQAWRLPRILSIAIETALRSKDTKALAHFRRGLDLRNQHQVSELEQSATDLDDEGLASIAESVRAIARRLGTR